MNGKKILVLNPNGTNIYDEVTLEVAKKAVSSETKVLVKNLSGSVPKTAFLPATSVLMNQLLTSVVEAEKEGFDAVVIACCSDPGLQDAKDLVSIPVTAPMEAAVHTAAPIGRLGVIAPRIDSGENENLPSDSNWVRKLIHLYGANHNFAGVRYAPAPHPSSEVTEKLISEDLGKLCRLVRGGMSKALDDKGIEESMAASKEDDAKVLFFACTIWGGLLDKLEESVPAKILDPVKTSVIFAEMLAKN